MKILKYDLCTQINLGTEMAPFWETVITPVTMGWNPANEEIARREAHQGMYTIEENQEEISSEPTPEERIRNLEEAMELLLSGVTE